MKTQKGFAPLILVVIGALVVGGVVYFEVNRGEKNDEPIVFESGFPIEKEPGEVASQNYDDQIIENTQDRDSEEVVVRQETVLSSQIKIIEPKNNRTYQQYDSIHVRWETNNMSGKKNVTRCCRNE